MTFRISRRLLFVIALLSVSIFACQKEQTPDAAAVQSTAPSTAAERISTADYLAKVTDEDVVLDVRTPQEFKSGHLTRATNIDVLNTTFRDNISGLDKDKTYYLYCHSGNRSGQAGEIMKSLGFKHVYNIGGFPALSAGGAEVSH